MKKLILVAALIGLSGSVMAQVSVDRQPLGSGTPGVMGIENAVKWSNDIWHAPQYMPGYPTSAVLYPRVIDVPCTKTTTGLSCKGYNWMPEFGRGEYLMIRPVIKEETPPQIIAVPVVTTVIKEVLIEVAPKKNRE